VRISPILAIPAIVMGLCVLFVLVRLVRGAFLGTETSSTGGWLRSPATARGVERFRGGDLAGAADELRASLRQHSTDVLAWIALGYCYLDAGDAVRGTRCLAEAARTENSLGPLLGIEVHPYGRFFEPEELAGLPQRLRPDREMLCWKTILEEGHAAALVPLEQVLYDSWDSALLVLIHATCLLGVGRRDEALVKVDRALRMDDRDAALLYQAGKVLRDAGELERAREVHQRLVQLHPGHALSHYALGRTWQAIGARPEAREAFAAAERLASPHAEVWLLIAEAYAERRDRDRDRASSALWEALHLAPPEPEWRPLVKRIARGLAALGQRLPAEVDPLA